MSRYIVKDMKEKRREERNNRVSSDLGGGDLLYIQSIFQKLGGREVLLHKVLQYLDPHVRVVNLNKQSYKHVLVFAEKDRSTQTKGDI